MKSKLINIIALSCVLILSISCKEQKEIPKESPKESKQSENFIVDIEYVTSQKNMFILYFYEEKGQFFEAENTVWLGIHPNDKIQRAVLEIPDQRLPIDLRINYCFEKLRGPIQFESITLKYLERSFKIPKEQILEYFTPNEYIDFDAVTGIATPKEINGKVDPFFISKDKLWNLIKNINDGTLNQSVTIN